MVDVEALKKEILDLGPLIIEKVQTAINQEVSSNGGNLDHYEIVWRQLQNIANREIKKLLEEQFPKCKITIPTSKSTYPDLKFEIENYIFAIDIKSNESQKNPWYDIARLDTIISERIEKYDEEYELVVKYDSETKQLLNLYFEYLRCTVGKNGKSGGVKYRPYDGKLRPKTWEDFDNNICYWNSKEEFLEGIKKSQIYRWKVLISETLLKILNKEEKEEFKKLFD